MKTKLKGKDLITIGIFSALYFVLSLICNMLGGFHAIVWFMTPVFAAIVCATPFMIMLAKEKKPFAIVISTTIVGLIYLITGVFPLSVPVTFFITGLIGEMIRKSKKYQSFKADAIAYAFVSLGMAASPLPLWTDTDNFIGQIKEFGMPQSYIDTCTALTSPAMLVLVIVLTIAGAFVGAYIAQKLFKKHFKKAGVV